MLAECSLQLMNRALCRWKNRIQFARNLSCLKFKCTSLLRCSTMVGMPKLKPSKEPLHIVTFLCPTCTQNTIPCWQFVLFYADTNSLFLSFDNGSFFLAFLSFMLCIICLNSISSFSVQGLDFVENQFLLVLLLVP